VGTSRRVGGLTSVSTFPCWPRLSILTRIGLATNQQADQSLRQFKTDALDLSICWLADLATGE
jgi:hypothetical protein